MNGQPGQFTTKGCTAAHRVDGTRHTGWDSISYCSGLSLVDRVGGLEDSQE